MVSFTTFSQKYLETQKSNLSSKKIVYAENFQKQTLKKNLSKSKNNLINNTKPIQQDFQKQHDIKNSIKKTTENEKITSFIFPIRVLLEMQNKRELVDWNIESTSGFIIVNPKHKKRVFIPSKNLNIKMGNKKWLLNGNGQHGENLFILPNKGNLKFGNFIYDGVFALASVGENGYLVNHVDLEDYVASVMKSESWPGWPDEINKAFSICFRSYGVAKILEQRQIYNKKKLAIPYDIKNSNIHQVYKGCNNTDFFKKIAKQTERIVLTYDNKPIVAMFDISCGGIIPAHLNGLDFKKAPYLSRNYKCNYCKNYNLTNWTLQLPISNFEKLINDEFSRFGKLTDIRITKKDKAGVVEQLSVKGSRRTITISAKKFKQLVKNLKSLCFTVSVNKNLIVISGKGYGHLTGLCQRGAHTMVTQGWSDKDILKFYYPGTTLMKLKGKAELKKN